jgi:hypothetical protein
VAKGHSIGEMLAQLKRAVQIAYMPFFAMWFIFVVTFIVFPGLCIGMGLKFMEGSKGFYPITVIIVFNILDTVGRQMGGMPFARKLTIKVVLILVISRLILVVLFFLFNLHLKPSWLLGDHADWLKMSCLIILSLSNGFLSTCAAIIAPGLVPDDLKPQTGTFSGIFIVFGIVCGSIVATFVPDMLAA